MQRIVSVVEKNVVAEVPIITPVVAGAKSVTAMPALANKRYEYAGRYLYNNGPSAVYYCIGQDCDAVTNFNGQIQPNQQLDCSNFPSRVDVFCPAGSATMATTILRRDDLTVQRNIIGQLSPLP